MGVGLAETDCISGFWALIAKSEYSTLMEYFEQRAVIFEGTSGNFVVRESGFLVLSNAVLVLVLEAP